MTTKLMLVEMLVDDFVCFRCSKNPSLCQFKKQVEEKWGKFDTLECQKCGDEFQVIGGEINVKPCDGDNCGKEIRHYLNQLEGKGKNYEHSNDRLRCPVCGRLFQLRNDKFVLASLEFFPKKIDSQGDK